VFFRIGLIAAGLAVSLAVLVAVVIGFFSSEAPATGGSVSVEPRSSAKMLVQESRFDPGEKLEIEDEPLPEEQPRHEEPAEPRKEGFWPEKSQSSYFRTTLPAPEEAATRPKDEERDLLEEPRYFDPEPGAVMSLTISSLGLYKVPVTSSDSQQVLDNGVIHLPETSLPWDGGDQRNVYIVGHRLGYEGTGSRLIFYKLNELGPGDEIILEGGGRIYRYQVSESFEVSPPDVWVTDQVRGRDLLTLQTCTPLPTFENRLIVRADRVSGPSTKEPTLTKEQPKRPASSQKHRSLGAEGRDGNHAQEEEKEKDDHNEEKPGLTLQRSEAEEEIRTRGGVVGEHEAEAVRVYEQRVRALRERVWAPKKKREGKEEVHLDRGLVEKRQEGKKKLSPREDVVSIEGEKLKELRLKRAMSQRELADVAGMSHQAIVGLETDRREPRPSTLGKLAEALGVEPSELLKA
jgi:sortase A